MRPPQAPPVSSSKPSLTSYTSNSTCTPHICRWQPYTNSNNFQDNVAMVLIILFCALICSVVLNATVRCFLRGVLGGGEHRPRRFGDGSHLPRTQQEIGRESHTRSQVQHAWWRLRQWFTRPVWSSPERRVVNPNVQFACRNSRRAMEFKCWLNVNMVSMYNVFSGGWLPTPRVPLAVVAVFGRR
ncbi:Actin 7 isoform 1 [Hibiscus syriacus]|uniref:Actin 7 isoform 1 n=1 Tax=Hibiscus syriacus TaxID=106335 RepID=A0A6A2ZRA4_HIBSY|nr:Actin 7 isoform 1 [Hibiscus syriacus]